MTPLLAFGILGFIVTAVALFVYGLGSRRGMSAATLRRRIAASDAFGVGNLVETELERSFYDRVVDPVVRGVGERIEHLTPGTVVDSIRVRLIQAGRRTPNAFWTFMALKAATTVLLPVFWLAASVSVSGSISLVPLLIAAVLVLVGWRLPDYWLDIAIGGRRNEIIRNLPDALDLLVVSVEAGLGLDAAFSTVSDKFAGVVGEEFGITMYEVSLGKRRREALRDMADRCQTSELTTFLTAIVRAEQTGVNVGDILRVQADGMRIRRRQRAVELGQQAPVKMLFPLVLGIFPALFIIILGPAIIMALNALNR